MKLALNMIVKASDQEADVLKRCLTSAAPHVDGIFITITGKNKRCEQVAKAFGAEVSYFEWENDFAKARNFALSQIPEDYDYWMWLDADDELEGGGRIKSTLEGNPSVDALVFNYFYAFDQWDNPVVVHAKTRVLRNDGCVEWIGKLHEDFHRKRQMDVRFVEDVVVLHRTNDERIETARERNVSVALNDVKEKPDDPRVYWNLGNAKKAMGENEQALEAFDVFLDTSKSDDEQYIVYLRRAEIFWDMNQMEEAIGEVRKAIAIFPYTPDAHILAARLYYSANMLMEAKESCMMGLKLEPKYLKTIVYNPRDYDYEPLKLLAQIYMGLALPQLALSALQACLQITPKDKELEKLIETMKESADISQQAIERMQELEKLDDDDELKKALAELDDDIRSHPAICHLRNTRLVKKESSGKDVVFYCGYTEDKWNPDIAKESGIGGSEEAVIHLSQRFAREGYNVTVYNNCGHRRAKYDGVEYRPYWEWNYRDKQDITIVWRLPKSLDYPINSDRIWIDMHDVIDSGEFTKKRLKRIDKIFFKSKCHRDLFPNVPEDKAVIIQNGIVWDQLQDDVERDPYLLVNTSSPDRSIKTFIEQFRKIKEEVPEAKAKWAYGWNVWDTVNASDAEKANWKKEVEQMIEGTPDFEAMGRIGHDEVAKLYQQAGIFAYPTAFYEIDCISARKAQAAGAVPVSTDFAALDETIQHGVKVKTNGDKENWGVPGEYNFGLQEDDAVNRWTSAVIKELKNIRSEDDRQEMREWTRQFDWDNIASKWLKQF